MFILIQSGLDGNKKKFLCSNSYERILDYIYTFSHVKKYGTNKFISNNIVFDIYLGNNL